MIVRPNHEGDAWLAVSLPWNVPRPLSDLPPGSHVVLLTGKPTDGLLGRRWGLELRDTLLVLTPTGASFAVLLRKEVEGTVAENVLRYRTGALNVNACRITSSEILTGGGGKLWSHYRDGTEDRASSSVNDGQGRWPSNLVLIHGTDCRMSGTRKFGSGEIRVESRDTVSMNVHQGYQRPNKSSYTHKLAGQLRNYGTETVTNWDCVASCPVAELDAQSGVSQSVRSSGRNGRDEAASTFGLNRTQDTERGHDDYGGASRFFPQFVGESEFLEWVGKLIGVDH